MQRRPEMRRERAVRKSTGSAPASTRDFTMNRKTAMDSAEPPATSRSTLAMLLRFSLGIGGFAGNDMARV